jgi:hypothetical protein
MASTSPPGTRTPCAKKTMNRDQALLDAFLHAKIESRDFHHADHVRVAFELLRHHGFPEAAAVYSTALKDIATRAGHPAAYHETVTVAFLSLIAEHAATGDYADGESFTRAHPELLNKSILGRWYARDRLGSDLARRTFILPEAAR